jgi:excinuclease UvrABC nuclease subunit
MAENSRNKKVGYVYKFLNELNEIVYIGSTGNIGNRMYNHFYAPAGHRAKKMQDGLERVREIRYCKLPTRNDALIVETILIHKYKPILNTESVSDGAVSVAKFDEGSVEWAVKTPQDFERKRNDYKSDRMEQKKTNNQVFNALRELFPDADLRKGSVTEKQKYILFAAFMSDGEYWFPRLTDFEHLLIGEELQRQLAIEVYLNGTER